MGSELFTMPEPVAKIINRPPFDLHTIQWCCDAKALPDGTLLVTADQLRAAVLEALTKMGDQMYDAMFDIKGDKVTRFDAQTAIRNIKESAIRQLAEQVKGVGNGN